MEERPSSDQDPGVQSATPPDTQETQKIERIESELTQESGRVRDDGRVTVNLKSKIAKAFAQIAEEQAERFGRPSTVFHEAEAAIPVFCDVKLNIVIQIVGSRGDVQPFIALGNALQSHGHRVRIATHDVFADFVRKSYLEFFPIGGDPAKLMAYMVKNPGLLPRMETLRDGEIKKKQVMVGEMLDGCWRSCIEDDPITQEPFVADAIIANPPQFRPCPFTSVFPHPLADLTAGAENEEGKANWVSYGVVEWLTWQGLGNVINKWRSSIDLPPVPATEGPCLAETLEVPFTYCWSPALVPRPWDWPAHVDLADFLQSGNPPVYIGFGSIVVDDAEKLINTVISAVSKAGVRAVVSKGWSELAGASDPNIFYIGDCPHTWLFQHVAAVVHHGGAGTTACGLVNGRPTTIVPFFGDQPFWGKMVSKAGAGPDPIPHAELTAENLANAMQFCLTPEAAAAAQGIAAKMQHETGVATAVNSFHRNLPLDRMRCSIMPNQPAVWEYKKGKQSLTLSKVAVNILVENNKIEVSRLERHAIKPIIIENRRWDPLTGVLSSLTGTGLDMAKSTQDMFREPYREYKRARSSNSLEKSESAGSPSSGSSSANRDPFETSGNMAGASLKAFGKFSASYFRGMTVDLPYAAAEGFRRAPQWYGEKPKDYGTVSDWKSGIKVGGKNFVGGMTSGIAGMIKEPLRGALEDGSDGATKGLIKGALGMATKMPSGESPGPSRTRLKIFANAGINSVAGIGLMAYPFQGIAKSIEASFRTKTPKAIAAARLREGFALTVGMEISQEEKEEILQLFDVLLSSMG
ncbi:Sterol 3-beta-glucosyltransferase [Penicillium chermesinum]|uniref:Sterol 3-beta-glucosyltransferase n=1 Tax=Penicillium chermesinum TaxID=63820 RepID=A0A9W9P685_9EURO|nr:Sterol 3-beta-glucosyltransferase [Penicillium chermesinum]KAJ5238331.1 Sterol 3-beta-glucosyltransferase [Penicillium chermesinum]